MAQTAGIVDYLLGPDIEGSRREIAHGRLMGAMLPERASQNWISPGRRARMETVLSAWYARLKSYLPPGTEEDRPIF
jgi:hypothetical protein